ncbi:MAG TPA: DUF5926 family protein [Mycobacteriales bacterium]
MSKRRTPRKEKVRDVFVPRPFEGLPGEADWVALREIVPAATARVRLADSGAEATIATVLPLGWPGLVRIDGHAMVGLQVGARSGDVSRDLGAVLTAALAAEPGSSITAPGPPGPRLQDLLAPDPLTVEVREGFSFWLDGGGADADPEVAASLERADAVVVPTVRLAAAPAAYWCRMPGRAHLRWVLPRGEDADLDALTRLYAEDALSLGDGTRYVGAFRAHGLLVPVWDLPAGPDADGWEEPLARLSARLDAVPADPLDGAERRVREGLRLRQVTIR